MASDFGTMAIATVVDSRVMPNDGVSLEAKVFAAETLGPMPGRWDGYDSLDVSTQQTLWSKVGFVHGLSAEAGRNIVSIGQTLREMKEMLPHGQFMACVKAEFGWGPTWTAHLMQVADRFSNFHSSGNLPSSAKVLAELAAGGADDATVQQAARECWTVKQTREHFGGKKHKERTVFDEALSVLKVSEEARRLAEMAEHISTRQLMDELDIDDLPKGKTHQSAAYTFCKNGTGWWKFPSLHDQEEEVAAIHQVEPTPRVADITEILPLAVAAQRLGKKLSTMRQRLTPASIAQHGHIKGNGWQAEHHSKRGHCLVRKIEDA